MKRKDGRVDVCHCGSLLAEESFKVSRNIVRKLLKKNAYVKRKALKKKALAGMQTAMPNLRISLN